MTTQQAYELIYRVTHDYFSDILSTQVAIFSLIVVSVVGFQFWLSYRVSKNKIEEEIKRRIKQVEDRLLKDYKKRIDFLVEVSAASERKLDNKNRALQADIYRTMGHFFDSEKQHSVAFIWWMRAVENYALSSEDRMVRASLRWARESVEKIKYAFEIESDIGEYQRILALLDNGLYGLEKEALDEKVRNTLNKKLAS